jgi:hypothetical protein
MSSRAKSDSSVRPFENVFRKAWQRRHSIFPKQGFHFGRPLVVLQSDDWGRVGIRDAECWEQLRSAGVNLGQRPYDFYSFENADDVEALTSMLNRHRDSSGRPACLGMNFILANVDFTKIRSSNFSKVHLRLLAEDLPEGWNRPGLVQAYREGTSAGVLSPGLHGLTHFCQQSAERYLQDEGECGDLLRAFWKAGVPYIYWRMPWIGFEYADPRRNGREEFLDSDIQEDLIDNAVAAFKQFFSMAPRSACAPGYRANRSTHRAWARNGIRAAQNGLGAPRAPHFAPDTNTRSLLQLYRTLDFEPAVEQAFSLEACIEKAEFSLARGIPAVVSVHSINFHSTIKDFRSSTLILLDAFLSALESRHPDLLYVRDEDLCDLVEAGKFESMQGAVRVPVTQQRLG